MSFAPDQMRKRITDWRPEELGRRFAAWAAFVPVVQGCVDVVVHRGPRGLQQVWLDVQGGCSAPGLGHRCRPLSGGFVRVRLDDGRHASTSRRAIHSGAVLGARSFRDALIARGEPVDGGVGLRGNRRLRLRARHQRALL